MDARTLADHLVQQGLIRPAAVQGALAALGETASRLDTVLLDRGLLSEEAMLGALGKLHSSRTAGAADLALATPEVARLVPPRVAARFEMVPFRLDGKTLHVAFADPGDLFVEDELAILTGCMVVSYAALEVRVYQALDRLYGVQCSPQLASVARRLDGSRPQRPPSPAAALQSAATPRAAPAQPPPIPSAPAPTPRPASPAELEISAEDLELFPSLARPTEIEAEDAGAMPVASSTPPPTIVPAPATDGTSAPATAQTHVLPESGSAEERLAAAAAALEAAQMRDDVADALLDFCRPYLKRRLIAVLRGQTVVGWRGEGEGVVRDVLRAISIPLDQPSVFMGLAQGQAFWLGPLPPMPHNLDLVLGLGGDAPRECLILPIVLRSKIVCFLYGDNGPDPVRSVPLAELRRLVAKAGVAFQVYLLKSKIRTL